MSAVIKQPTCKEERMNALQALLSCPTGSIRTETPPTDIGEAQETFPLSLDKDKLPGVFHCGFHSKKSFGATSYLILHPEGNILVDSPRYVEKLAGKIEKMGGVRYMFLTHRDDVADHKKWADRFKCTRILHSEDVQPSTTDVELKLEGSGPWKLYEDVELIHTPGHTEGSVCLFHKPLKALFTGDHLTMYESGMSIIEMYNHCSLPLQLESVERLIKLDFNWVIPDSNYLMASSISHDPSSSSTSLLNLQTQQSIFGYKDKVKDFEKTQLRIPVSFRKKGINLQMMASGKTPGLTQEANDCTYEANIDRDNNNTDVFDDMKQRFLAFKRLKYMDNLEHYKKLADAQAPKFLVIACADSRVCPSAVLGFQPGEAFTVRNIANLVPPYESGPTETKAALQFSVNTLEVENILVIGHSRCGGIQALMGMEEVDSRSFIHNWVIVGKKAKESTKAVASNLHFDHQCQHCEKTSINHSLERLLGYPWIEEKVRKGSLSLHGGYYDFVNCTFEKWTVDYEGSRGSGIAVKNRCVLKISFRNAIPLIERAEWRWLALLEGKKVNRVLETEGIFGNQNREIEENRVLDCLENRVSETEGKAWGCLGNLALGLGVEENRVLGIEGMALDLLGNRVLETEENRV
uniref:carbonic anhydrase n=1 Tax=Brassica campestris TaxID=3711 RepID=M4D4Q0_BRACM